MGNQLNSVIVRSNGRTLSLQYDNRMRLTRWDVPGVMGWEYNYSILAENSFRVSYARNLYDGTLDRSYDYDHLGRLNVSHSGAEARAHVSLGSWGTQDGPYSHHYNYDQFGNITYRAGWGGMNASYTWGFTNNRLNGMVYDAAGNLTDAGGGWTFTYDATGQQTSSAAYNLQQFYDGDRLRGNKTENGVATYYLRSSVLGGQVVAEMNGSGVSQRGYVYLGGQTIAVQQQSAVYWMHEDPVAKSKRVTDSAGNVVSTIELDPWGGETSRSSNEAFQPKKFTTYERDVNGSDEAMHRRYNRWWSRFEPPDPYDGSYSLTDPQSFNRYAYVQGDPVNFVDPTGLDPEPGPPPNCGTGTVPMLDAAGVWQCVGTGNTGVDVAIPSDFPWEDLPGGGLMNWPNVPLAMIPLEPPVGPGGLIQEKPQLERNLSHDPKNFDIWNNHVRDCALAKGLEIGADGLALGAGQPALHKRFTTPGASPGTSPLSRGLGNGPRIGRVWAPTLNNLGAHTSYLGRAVSRWIPWAAGAHLALHFAQVVKCANERYARDPNVKH